MTKEDYRNAYTKKMDELIAKWEKNPDYDGTQATLEMEDVANVKEIVGYYIYWYEEYALIQWKENVEGKNLKQRDIEVTRILEELFK